MPKYKWDNIILFVEQLASAAKLDLPLDKTIQSLSVESIEPGWKRAQESVSELHGLGSPLSDAMESNSAYFPSMLTRLVRIGEEGKVLAAMLSSISQYLQSAREIQHKLQKCLVYPFFVWCVLCFEIAVMFVWAIPKMTEMFSIYGSTPPGITRFLIHAGPVLFVLGVGMVFYLAWLMIGLLTTKLDDASRAASWADRLLPYIPFLGMLARHAKTAQVCDVLGVLMDGGNSGREAVVLAKGMLTSESLKLALDEVETAILSADEFQPSDQQTLIPQTTLWMISQGNGKGDLALTLKSLAQLHKRKLDMLSSLIREILEPVLLIIVAVMAGIAIVGFYAPIFSITNTLF